MSDIKLFESKQVRSYWDEKEEQWYFSVVDVLTETVDSKDYWYRMKKEKKSRVLSYR